MTTPFTIILKEEHIKEAVQKYLQDQGYKVSIVTINCHPGDARESPSMSASAKVTKES